jgi:AraC family transcriptional regulator
LDWINSIKKATLFIENQLCNEALVPELVAQQVHISSAHFTRAFHVLTGLTVSEYIRNRRLTVAGEMLKTTDKTVLDVALDVGYESPEAFAKAFKRFHGINPSESKTGNLNAFYPIQVKVILTHDRPLSNKIIDSPPIYLNGNTLWVDGDDDFATAHIWKTSEANGHLDHCYAQPSFEALVGVYAPQGYTIKAKSKVETKDSLVLPAHKWIIFSCEGQMPQAINDTWNKIYSEWMSKTEYTISDIAQLEVYTESVLGYSCEIWIGIE